MKRLLLLLVPLVLADPAIAFDGGWYDKEEKPELSTDQSETLAKYSEFHQSCMDIQMTMWGEVAELMEDLVQHTATANTPSWKTWKVLLGQIRMLLILNVPTKAQLVKKKLSSGGLCHCIVNA